MSPAMTLEDLSAPNDLLIEHDRLPPNERPDLLRRRIGDPDLARAFELCARDEAFRGLMEFEWNANLPTENYLVLEWTGALRREAEPFRSEVPLLWGVELHAIAVDRRRARRLAPRLPGGLHPHAVLRGAVCGYAARDTGGGIVLRRDLLEASFAECDPIILTHAVDPIPGQHRLLLDGLGVDFFLHEHVRRSPELGRREALERWGAVAGHGTAIHELDAAPPGDRLRGDALADEFRPHIARIISAVDAAHPDDPPPRSIN